MGDMIKSALINVPKMPVKYDKRNATVTGINSSRRPIGAKDTAKKNFSKFMLDRLKK